MYQPQQQQQYPPPPPPAQPVELQTMAYARPTHDLGGYQQHKPPYPGIVGNTVLTVIVVISVLMLFLGAMLVHYAPLITNKKYTADDEGIAEMNNDLRTQKTTDSLGRILVDVGSFLLVFILLIAGMFRSDWSEYVRFGVLFFVAVFSFAIGFRI
jgi:hypothetical protein